MKNRALVIEAPEGRETGVGGSYVFALDDGVGSSTSSCSYPTIPAGRWHGLVLAARDDPHHNGVEANAPTCDEWEAML